MKVIAVVPAFNEAERIGNVIRKIKNVKVVDKIIVIDDGSKDSTSLIARKNGATVIKLAMNQGVGKATRVGLKEALKMKSEIIVFLDADGQHDPRYIPKFISSINEGNEFVLGKRNLEKYPFIKKFGNRALAIIASLICPTGLHDPECGFRAIDASAARKMKLQSDNYSICMDFIWNIWKLTLKVKEIPINVPVYYVKKGTKISTGITNALHLLKRRIFG